MAAERVLLLLLLSAAAMVGLASAAGPYLSDGVFQAGAGSTGRSLLQTKKSCPVNFEFQNYRVILSQCKGPTFPAKECCAAFKEFACPFAEDINDDSSDCSSTMFSYINLYGKYPPGLFSNECKEGKLGLSCAGIPQKSISTANGVQHAQSSLLALILIVCVAAALLFH